MLTGFLFTAMAALPAPEIVVTKAGANFQLRLGTGRVFRNTPTAVRDMRTQRLSDGTVIGFWTEGARKRYLVSKDGSNVVRDTVADYQIQLKYGSFDPLVATPPTNPTVESSPQNEVFLIQFTTQPLDIYLQELEAQGVVLYDYLTNHSFIAKVPAEARDDIRALSYVRWMGAYESAYRLDPELMTQLQAGTLTTRRYNIWCHQRGTAMQNSTAMAINQVGGTVHEITGPGFRMSATLTPLQLKQLLTLNEVSYVDEWGPPQQDMDNVRAHGGGTFTDTLGFTGQGVRAEVMDGGLRRTHSDFSPAPALIHSGTNTTDSHGTATYGINFGKGVANAAGRGMMPNAQGVFAQYTAFSGGNRYTHTAELLNSPYFCVYQSNSWGGTLTTSYTTVSAEMDDILFINNITILNSQSNTGNRNSRPQAWAKNVVSIGAFNHFNNLNDADDRWSGSASIGPAADNRVKPELAFWYDSIFTTTSSSDTAYTSSFGGTSAATPMTAGHFGIMFQMWHLGLFNVPVPAATVFDNRPRSSLAKAIMVNTARQKPLPVVAPNDINRNVQGWGVVNLQDLHGARNGMMLVNETVSLNNLETATYKVQSNGTTPLKITMNYIDPAGTPGAGVARKNNLSLRVTGPGGTIWWGNNGMAAANWTASGGTENTVDTLENVYIQAPAAGVYTVEVIGSDINTDARPETPGINADFALVASGIMNGPLAPSAFAVLDSGLAGGNLASLGISDNNRVLASRGISSSKSTFTTTVDMTFTSPLSSHGKGTLVLERSAATALIDERVDIFNNNTGVWDSHGTATVPTTDGVREVNVANMAPYVLGGQIRVRLNYSKTDNAMARNATVDVDFARFSLQPL